MMKKARKGFLLPLGRREKEFQVLLHKRRTPAPTLTLNERTPALGFFWYVLLNVMLKWNSLTFVAAPKSLGWWTSRPWIEDWWLSVAVGATILFLLPIMVTFFGDGAHNRVEMILRVLGLTVPPHGSYSPLCATFQGPDWKPDKDFLENRNESTLVTACERDAPVTITHQRCNTQNSRMVDKQALERGVVIIRCSGCEEFVPVADHAFFFQRGTHGEVEEYLNGIRGSYNIPAKGSNNSFCATYEPLDWFARKTGKISGSAADESATHFGWAKEIDNENPKGNGTAFVKKERDHDVAYTHPACTTKLVRKVSREAFERGVVVARCTGCNQVVSLADHIGWFGRLQHPSSLENFLTNFRGEIKLGSENTFCVTAETMDFCHTQRKQGKK